MTDKATRAWCADIQYPGKRAVRFGTVVLPADTMHHEILKAVEASALECIPEGFKIVRLAPGFIFFVPEDGLPQT